MCAVYFTPAVFESGDDVFVIVGSCDFNVYALDARTGSERWIIKAADYFIASPTFTTTPAGAN
jgi:outer membrane protein assembly factor BamB